MWIHVELRSEAYVGSVSSQSSAKEVQHDNEVIYQKLNNTVFSILRKKRTDLLWLKKLVSVEVCLSHYIGNIIGRRILFFLFDGSHMYFHPSALQWI